MNLGLTVLKISPYIPGLFNLCETFEESIRLCRYLITVPTRGAPGCFKNYPNVLEQRGGGGIRRNSAQGNLCSPCLGTQRWALLNISIKERRRMCTAKHFPRKSTKVRTAKHFSRKSTKLSTGKHFPRKSTKVCTGKHFSRKKKYKGVHC